MFHTKKSILTTIFTFFIFSHVSALNMQDVETDSFFGMESTSETTTQTTQSDTTQTNSSNISTFDTSPYNTTYETDTEKVTLYTITHEDHIDLAYDYCNKKTGEIGHGQIPLYPDVSLRGENKQQFDLPSDLNFNNQNNSNSDTINDHRSSNTPPQYDIFTDKLKDDLFDSRKQEIEEHHNSQRNDIKIKNNCVTIRDYLNEIHATNNLINTLSHPMVVARFQEIRDSIANQEARKSNTWFRTKTISNTPAELKFLDALISGEIVQLLKETLHSNLLIAENAFIKLKELWPWKRGHTFLIRGPISNAETSFISKLGIDIMKIAEKDLITRQDYIAKYTDTQSIKEYKKKSFMLQKNAVSNSLFEERNQLRRYVTENIKKNDLTANICLAIAKNAVFDPIGSIFHGIVHTPSLEKARIHLHHLEAQILDQAKQKNVVLTDQIKNLIIEQYGIDILEAGYNCYTSRPDYIKIVNDLPILSNNNISPILHNIENKPLPAAHKELTHLQKQIIGTLESFNITDKAIQKELIVKKFGIDILEQTNNAYKNRSDHKELINSFIPIDVHNASINILNTSHDYASVGQQFDTMAEQVFHNARLCKIDFIENIENHVIDSIHIIKAPQNDAQFIFNVTVVDHLLTDIQHKVDNIVEGKSTSYMQCIGRGSELFTRAIVKFIEGLNPITQVKSIGELLQGAGHLTSHIIQHPIDSLHTLREINTKTCELLVNTAIFTSDTIFETTYLTPEEYQQRSNAFWKTVQSVPAESIVDVVAQVAADFAVGKGVIKVFVYIKEIDAAIKLENYAVKVADKLKQAVDIHLGDNPIIVTAEGLVLKTSNDLKKFGETIKNSSISQKIILRVNNMKEFFELPFGRMLHPHSLKTSYQYQKFSIIYKLTENIPGTRLKKGYFYYLDRLHGDHLEVFDKQLRVAAVYNLDGTFNMAKFESAQKAGRTIKLT